MTAQIDLRPDSDVSREPGVARKPLRVLWPILLLIAMAVAGVVGMAVAANLTEPAAPTPVIYAEPSANSREGHGGASVTQEPNANEREGRVPDTTSQQPNANTRERRIPVNS